MKERQDNLGRFGFSSNIVKSNFNRKFHQLTSLETKTKAYEKAQKIQKEALLTLLDLLLSSVNIPQKQRAVGHPFSNLRDIIFCCAVKTYLTVSSRRLMSELRAIHDLGYIQTVPSFTVINSYMRNKELGKIIKELIRISSLPFKDLEDTLLIDSSGFSTKKYLAWQDAKFNPSKSDKWVKAHLCISEKSLIITAVEVTKSDSHDSLYFKPLLKQTVEMFKRIKYLAADKGYLSKENYTFARSSNIDAYIPFKSNTILTKSDSSEWERKIKEYFNNKEEFEKRYHRRSLIESVNGMIKAKHFQKIYSKSTDGAMNEVLFKCLIHNIYILTVYYNEIKNENY